MIWFALIFPFLGIALLLSIKSFREKTVWWELAIPLGITILAIFISKLIIDKSMTDDTEYWGSYVISAEYYEDWNEYIHQTCTRTYTDSDGNSHTETYDCSYVSYHSEYWQVNTNIGQELKISESRFNYYVKKFGGKQFVDLHRDYHTDDGDKYVAKWNYVFEMIEPITVTHTYENRVAASHSIFKFEEPDTANFKLFDYIEPDNNYQINSILTEKSNIYNIKEANKLLSRYNAFLGNKKQVRIWFLIFDNKDYQYAIQQENYWQGGNKNEFIVSLSVDDSNYVQWCKVISWTDVEQLKVDVRNYIKNMNKLDLINAVEYIKNNIETRFVRKSFKEFDYLTVEPTTTALIIVYILSLLITIGTTIFVIKNEI
jgi:hypothetical protein